MSEPVTPDFTLTGKQSDALVLSGIYAWIFDHAKTAKPKVACTPEIAERAHQNYIDSISRGGRCRSSLIAGMDFMGSIEIVA